MFRHLLRHLQGKGDRMLKTIVAFFGYRSIQILSYIIHVSTTIFEII